MKRLLISLGVLFTLLIIQPTAISAQGPVPCTGYTTALSFDGKPNLTACLHNRKLDAGDSVNATGYDIALYFDFNYAPAGMAFASNAEIFGATYFGVVNDGTHVDVGSTLIHDIGESPFTSALHGIAIYFKDGATAATGNLTSNLIDNYQYAGILIDSAGASSDISFNTIAGRGPISAPAQRGIWFQFGAGGSAHDNTISNNYDSTNPKGKDPITETGCGILLVSDRVNHGRNTYSGNEKHVCSVK